METDDRVRIPGFEIGKTKEGDPWQVAASIEWTMTAREIKIDGSLGSRTRPRGRGGIAAQMLWPMRESFVLCGGAKNWVHLKDGSALRGEGWRA